MTVTGWQPIKLAPFCEWVLACNPKYGPLPVIAKRTVHWCDSCGDVLSEDPSHWMPLPDPPEAS